ncbi:Cytochrome P450 monooxygenase [Lachnellula occidentalis]|uniref:Cytochrome P450 monooxygenase n=1 Tax=Lachnellula occidentalis TaxID=215460 RepID=A0A8H8RVR8_9HELO|nr:Cytochrome P450 monooxygenase [Lachnellula occidentalis]
MDRKPWNEPYLTDMDLRSFIAGHFWQILASISILYVARKVVLYHRLRKFPGPPLTGFTDFFHNKAFIGGRCYEWYTHASETYGSIVRVGPNTLITSSPDVWTHVNIKPAYKRSNWYYRALRIEHGRDHIFSQTDNYKHGQRRKQMAPAYSGKENPELEPAIDARLRDLLNLIRSKYLSTETRVVPMDLAKKVQFFTLDVISTIGLGKCFGMLENDTDVSNYAESSEKGLHASGVAIGLGFGLIAQLPWIGKFIAPSPKDCTGFGKMMGTCFRYVDERAAKPFDTPSDMLASFMRHGLTHEELRSEALEQVFAGSDNTATAIRGSLLYIMTNPRVYRKLQREIDEAVQTGISSENSSRIVSYAQAKRLPYLQAVIREGIRTFTPAVNTFPRDVPPGGDTVIVDGKLVFLPGGTCIGYSGQAMHHDKAVYGEDAKSFRPERWFEKDPEKLAAMIKTNDLVFGHGNWQCLGKPVAYNEINKIIFEVNVTGNPKALRTIRNLTNVFVVTEKF